MKDAFILLPKYSRPYYGQFNDPPLDLGRFPKYQKKNGNRQKCDRIRDKNLFLFRNIRRNTFVNAIGQWRPWPQTVGGSPISPFQPHPARVCPPPCDKPRNESHDGLNYICMLSSLFLFIYFEWGMFIFCFKLSSHTIMDYNCSIVLCWYDLCWVWWFWNVCNSQYHWFL